MSLAFRCPSLRATTTTASDNHSSQVAIASARLILHINPISDPAYGDSFQVFVADTVNGIPSIATEGWAYDSTTGSVVFGQLVGCNPDSLGDFDGNGTVDFLDFLQLAQNFGDEVSDHTFGDVVQLRCRKKWPTEQRGKTPRRVTNKIPPRHHGSNSCLLYTSDAADE